MSKENYAIREKKDEFDIFIWKEKNPPLMQCGHVAQAIWHADKLDNKDIWTCVICDGKESRVITEQPDLKGRFASCSYRDCQSKQPSSLNLAFFEHKPEKEYDGYYCGCKGWD